MTSVALAIAWTSVAMTAYYLVLFALALTRCDLHGRSDPRLRAPCFVIVVPARNEAVVIGRTVERILELDGSDLLALVMDDGSDDGTADAARAAAGGDPRVMVHVRGEEIAGCGKGDVLNHASRIVGAMVDARDPRLGGRDAREVVVCILDADGWLERATLAKVAPYFDDPDVAGVQLPVRMWNARAGFLARMQDIEFVGYGFLFQAARDRIGSVLMGGNGQFVRLEALRSLGDEPWTDCLTEDLEIGLRLVERGWRHRYCGEAWVAQQALVEYPRFLRQRTRWVQGHLTCWAHLRPLWTRRANVPIRARLDLSLHLLLGTYGLIAAIQVAVAIATAAGLLAWRQVLPLDAWPIEAIATTLVSVTLAPILLISLTYQRHAHARLPALAAPGVLLLYGAYHYLWSTPATLLAVWRIATGRRSWAKTARTSITSNDLEVEAIQEGARP